MKNTILFQLFKYILTGLAIINLILLFVFQYEIPESVKNRFFPDSEDISMESTEAKEKEDPFTITFEEDPLTYDGSTQLDLTKGVRILDPKGAELDLKLYSSIKRTKEQNKKIISYTAKDENGASVMTERTLLLENYTGPTLTVETDHPAIYDVELEYILETFQDEELLKAEDGYGKDITGSITCSHVVTNDIATEVEITFIITNHLDDTTKKAITCPIERTRPLILLTDKTVTLKKEDSFDPLSYVVSATNEEGEDLRRIIETEGTVDTSVPGTYEVAYSLVDSDNEASHPVSLTVFVKE